MFGGVGAAARTMGGFRAQYGPPLNVLRWLPVRGMPYSPLRMTNSAKTRF